MTTTVGKPVIEISLLPAQWGKDQFKLCFDEVLEAVRQIRATHVRSKDDLIVLFPTDRWEVGLGTEIVIKIDLPNSCLTESGVMNEVADRVQLAIQRLLPDAYVQCVVSVFEIGRGFMSTAPRAVAK